VGAGAGARVIVGAGAGTAELLSGINKPVQYVLHVLFVVQQVVQKFGLISLGLHEPLDITSELDGAGATSRACAGVKLPKSLNQPFSINA
jgi:hypothetical protein